MNISQPLQGQLPIVVDLPVEVLSMEKHLTETRPFMMEELLINIGLVKNGNSSELDNIPSEVWKMDTLQNISYLCVIKCRMETHQHLE